MTTLHEETQRKFFGEHPCSESPIAFAEYALRNTPAKHWPYAHTLANPIFPAAYYNALISAFPGDGSFTPLNEYHADRGAIFLTPDRDGGTDDLDRLDDSQRKFWEHFVEIFGTARFRRALLHTLAGPEFAGEHLPRTRSLIHLSLDRTGYQIRPHTDIAQKIISVLFYLPDLNDFTAAEFGTSVLVKQEGKDESDPHDWASYETAFTAPFIANTMFAFRVGDASWHGVKPVDQPIRRRSIQYFVIFQ